MQRARFARFVLLGTVAALLLATASPPAGADPPKRSTSIVPPLPTPSPASTVGRFAFNADGTKLTSFRGLADSAIIIIGGRKTTVGAVRAGVRAATLLHLGAAQKSPRLHRSYAIATLPEQTEMATQPSALGLAHISKTAYRDDPNFCKTHSAYILSAKGKIAPGGYVTADGVCFGTGGQIRLEGRFDGGALALQVQHWDDGTIFAAIPAVSGVFDQQVKLQVVNGSVYSNEVTFPFVATRERLVLPTHFITNDTCSARWAPATCLDATGFRMDLSSPQGQDYDIWRAHAPPGWVLDELDYRTGLGTVSELNFEDANAPPDSATWYMNWKVAFQKSVTHSQDGGFFGGMTGDTYSWTDDYYGSSYSMTVYAIGPAGTMPQ